MREDNRIEVVRNRYGLHGGRISWAAILAGVAVALAVSLLLGSLGAGLGAGTIDPTEERNPFAGLGVGALLWIVLTGILSFFVGGWVAGYGSNALTFRSEAVTHGLVTWAVASILGVWFITGAAGNLLTGGASLIGKTLSGGSQAVAQTPELNERIREELERRGIDLESLGQQAQTPETQAQAEDMARQAGETVARGISWTALGAFGMLLLNLLASILGALAAARRHDRELTRVERAA